MTEPEWAEEGEPKKKRGIPKWVWFGCGGGCLLFAIAALASGVLVTKCVQDSWDPEKQWPKLERVLPFDERPPYELEMGMNLFVMQQYVLVDRATGVTGMVMSFKESASQDYQEMFKEDPAGAPFGIGAPQGAEVGETEIQGRFVRYLRYDYVKSQKSLGAGIRVDLGDGGSRYALLQLTTGGDPVTDEQVHAFLEPFDVWRGQ